MRTRAVIDASATGSWLFQEEASRDGDRLFMQVLLGNVQLIQPVLWSYEIINLLRTAIQIKKRLNKADGIRLLKFWEQIPVKYEDHEPGDNSDIINCALQHTLSGYNAVYFCLAQKNGIDLITEDSHLLKLKKKYSWIKRLEETG